jgi:hypothetical protein
MRVFFQKAGSQKKFLQTLLSRISVKEAAKLCGVSERTIRDWSQERFSMDYKALKILCNKIHFPFPSDIKLKDRYWYVKKAASKGGKMLIEKYGKVPCDSEYRKKKWHQWWEKEGKYKKHPIIGVTKPIKKPRFSKELAEFVGILLGDGCISQYQISISLNYKNEKDYGKFVKSLIKKLFDVPVSTYWDKKYSRLVLTVSRNELVRFCIEKLGLNQGNKVKQQIDIPNWIKQNKSYLTACVQGLMDTEGSVFSHKYRVNGKIYSYKKISFKNSSYPLIKSVYNFLKGIGLNHPRITKNFREVRIENKDDVEKYFQLIGFHNPKNLKRYKE